MELEKLCEKIRAITNFDEKLCFLENLESIQAQMVLPLCKEIYSKLMSKEHKCAFLSLIVLEEAWPFFTKPTISLPEIVEELENLAAVDRFYYDIGGLLGYVLKVKTLLKKPQKDVSKMEIQLPSSESILGEGIFVKHASTFGLAHLDRVAIIVTAGGLGARLGLVDDQEQPVPVASLPFMGRPLLEGIVRDLEGLEQLYFATYGHKIIIPMAVMTSKEQKNEENIRTLLKKHEFFGRPLSSIRIFSQISVPVLTIEGKFAATQPGKFLFHPSGHGALWKTAEEAGIFRWLKEKRIEHLLLRQINNPLAALDHNLLAFLGLAIRQRKSFGFFVCERLQGAAEGALVHVHEKTKHYITNIEYSELQLQEGLANTNILYANVDKVREKLKISSLFGPLLNMKSEVPYCLPDGTKKKIRGGRLESMMQNISEEMSAQTGEALPTLVVQNRRKKTISAIKREYDPEQGPLETAEAACYTLLENNHELLARCTVEPLPPFFSLEEFLEKGPSIFFSYHPMLGPLYEIIEKKLHVKNIAFGSLLQLEIANFKSHNLELRGSLFIEGVGGCCVLNNVQVNNLGIDRSKTQSYCSGEIIHQESCRIVIGDRGELVAENITFSGDQLIEVPPETRLLVRQDSNGNLLFKNDKIIA